MPNHHSEPGDEYEPLDWKEKPADRIDPEWQHFGYMDADEIIEDRTTDLWNDRPWRELDGDNK